MAMIAITTNSSIRVNAFVELRLIFIRRRIQISLFGRVKSDDVRLPGFFAPVSMGLQWSV
jgi:hypothetical protein